MRRVLIAVAFAAGCAFAAKAESAMPSVGPGANGVRYATDAYPGFDDTDEMTKPERKEPRWFSFINGPNRPNAREQLAYCTELLQDEDFKKASKQLDALVREWPTSEEAPKAQQALAEVLLNQLQDYEEAFAEYRYLLDFYSLHCDYEKMADMLYQVAGILKTEGKEVMFIRFANTVDVRRAYETCVLRAPGAKWVPEAMLIIGALREDEGRHGEAIKVYENLRNLYPDTAEAKTALAREADDRMKVLGEHEYNRSRCRDTIDFLKLALTTCNPSDADRMREYLGTAQEMIEREDYLGAKFYDSPTRTRRSAIRAYERFLDEHPAGERAEDVRGRLEELKGEEK